MWGRQKETGGGGEKEGKLGRREKGREGGAAYLFSNLTICLGFVQSRHCSLGPTFCHNTMLGCTLLHCLGLPIHQPSHPHPTTHPQTHTHRVKIKQPTQRQLKAHTHNRTRMSTHRHTCTYTHVLCMKLLKSGYR